MFDVRLMGKGQPHALQSANAKLTAVLRNDLLREALEVWNKVLESADAIGT
jgi:hypothetical protein